MKTEGCWAKVLDDCRGELTGEHIVSVNVWAPPEGRSANRAAREKRMVTVAGDRNADGRTYQQAVAHLKRKILCEHHNSSTNDLDEEGGRLARAIESFDAVLQSRSWAPTLNWNWRRLRVDGLRIQRWFLKTTINQAFGCALAIGGPDAAPGWPTAALVEMVFGRRPIEPPAGLFVLARTGATHHLAENFGFYPFDRNGEYIAGAVLTFRSLNFGVHYERAAIPRGGLSADRSLPVFSGTTPLQRIRRRLATH